MHSKRDSYTSPCALQNLLARKQVIQICGVGTCRPVYVVRSDGSVRTVQVFIPDLFREVAPDGVRDAERLAARPGARWCAAETVAGVTLGDEVELRHGDVAVAGDAALFIRGCNWLKALAWRAEEDGVCDQMNLGGLGCLEWIRRRIAVLVEARSQPSRSNWTAARYLEGAPMCEEVILLGLNTYAMRRTKEEVDIQNAQHRSYTHSSANEEDNDVRLWECSLDERWMILLDATRELAHPSPRYTEP